MPCLKTGPQSEKLTQPNGVWRTVTVLVEDFEEEAYALKPARPVEVLRELIESNGLKQKICSISSHSSMRPRCSREARPDRQHIAN